MERPEIENESTAIFNPEKGAARPRLFLCQPAKLITQRLAEGSKAKW
jgi:hypothetical protein